MSFRSPKAGGTKSASASDIMRTLKEACEEANHYTPIFLVINSSKWTMTFNSYFIAVNVHGTIQEFHRAFPEYQSSRLHYVSLGKGLEKRVEEKILNSSQAGDWLLLENLDLMIDWIPKLEELL